MTENDGDPRVLVPLVAKTMVRKGEWVPYEGPQGGTGWQNTETGDVVYDDEAPGDTPEGVPGSVDELREQVESGELDAEDLAESGGDEPESEAGPPTTPGDEVSDWVDDNVRATQFRGTKTEGMEEVRGLVDGVEMPEDVAEGIKERFDEKEGTIFSLSRMVTGPLNEAAHGGDMSAERVEAHRQVYQNRNGDPIKEETLDVIDAVRDGEDEAPVDKESFLRLPTEDQKRLQQVLDGNDLAKPESMWDNAVEPSLEEAGVEPAGADDTKPDHSEPGSSGDVAFYRGLSQRDVADEASEALTEMGMEYSVAEQVSRSAVPGGKIGKVDPYELANDIEEQIANEYGDDAAEQFRSVLGNEGVDEDAPDLSGEPLDAEALAETDITNLRRFADEINADVDVSFGMSDEEKAEAAEALAEAAASPVDQSARFRGSNPLSTKEDAVEGLRNEVESMPAERVEAVYETATGEPTPPGGADANDLVTDLFDTATAEEVNEAVTAVEEDAAEGPDDDTDTDNTDEKANDGRVLHPSAAKLLTDEKSEWVPYEGPRGGVGWQNAETGDVTYSEEAPGDTPDGVPGSVEELKDAIESGELNESDMTAGDGPSIPDVHDAARDAGIDAGAAERMEIDLDAYGTEDINDTEDVREALSRSGWGEERVDAVVGRLEGEDTEYFPEDDILDGEAESVTVDGETYEWTDDPSTPHPSGGYYQSGTETVYPQDMSAMARRADDFEVDTDTAPNTGTDIDSGSPTDETDEVNEPTDDTGVTDPEPAAPNASATSMGLNMNETSEDLNRLLEAVAPGEDPGSMPRGDAAYVAAESMSPEQRRLYDEEGLEAVVNRTNGGLDQNADTDMNEDNDEPRVLHPAAAKLMNHKSWVPYEGDRGGTGWQNPETGDVVYSDEAPGDTPEGVPGSVSELREQIESGELTVEDVDAEIEAEGGETDPEPDRDGLTERDREDLGLEPGPEGEPVGQGELEDLQNDDVPNPMGGGSDSGPVYDDLSEGASRELNEASDEKVRGAIDRLLRNAPEYEDGMREELASSVATEGEILDAIGSGAEAEPPSTEEVNAGINAVIDEVRGDRDAITYDTVSETLSADSFHGDATGLVDPVAEELGVGRAGGDDGGGGADQVAAEEALADADVDFDYTDGGMEVSAHMGDGLGAETVDDMRDAGYEPAGVDVSGDRVRVSFEEGAPEVAVEPDDVAMENALADHAFDYVGGGDVSVSGSYADGVDPETVEEVRGAGYAVESVGDNGDVRFSPAGGVDQNANMNDDNHGVDEKAQTREERGNLVLNPLVAKASTRHKAWIPYEGPQGGTGWQNPETGDVVYDDEAPGDTIQEGDIRDALEEAGADMDAMEDALESGEMSMGELVSDLEAAEPEAFEEFTDALNAGDNDTVSQPNNGDGSEDGDGAVDTADLESAAREHGYDEMLDAYSGVAGEDAAGEVRAEISEMGGDVNENVAGVLADRLVDDEASELMDQMGDGPNKDGGGDGGGGGIPDSWDEVDMGESEMLDAMTDEAKESYARDALKDFPHSIDGVMEMNGLDPSEYELAGRDEKVDALIDDADSYDQFLYGYVDPDTMSQQFPGGPGEALAGGGDGGGGGSDGDDGGDGGGFGSPDGYPEPGDGNWGDAGEYGPDELRDTVEQSRGFAEMENAIGGIVGQDAANQFTDEVMERASEQGVDANSPMDLMNPSGFEADVINDVVDEVGGEYADAYAGDGGDSDGDGDGGVSPDDIEAGDTVKTPDGSEGSVWGVDEVTGQVTVGGEVYDPEDLEGLDQNADTDGGPTDSKSLIERSDAFIDRQRGE